MNFDPDDPRLSALALGELEPAEAVEMEAMLAGSPEAWAAVEEIRAAARVLTASLAREAAPSLDAPRKRAIESRLKSRRRARLVAGLGTLAAAACAVLAVRLTLAPAGDEAIIRTKGSAGGKATPGAPRSSEEAHVAGSSSPMNSDPGYPAGPPAEARPSLATSEMYANNQRNQAATPAPSGPSAPQQYGLAGGAPDNLAAGRDRFNRGLGREAEGQARGRSMPSDPSLAKPGADAPQIAATPSPRPLSAVALKDGATAPDVSLRRKDAMLGLALAEGEVFAKVGPGPGGLMGEDAAGRVQLKESLARKDADIRGNQGVDRPPAPPEAADGAKRERVPIVDPNALAPEPAPAPAPVPATVENPFVAAAVDPLSTFAVDVDTASYSQIRKSLMVNLRPDPEAVRVEEMVNYFAYKYPQPTGDEPFSVTADVARCPWDASHRLARIGLRGKDVDLARRPASNLVFLLDVSGSMNEPNKLPLVKQAMGMLVERLGENDRVSMVVYAGASGVALPPTHGDRKPEILSALEELQAGGSTDGGAGIKLAYDLAAAQFIKGGINRVILCTDGDFNVGTTGVNELETLIEQRRKTGVFLSVLGFGLGDGKNNAGAREVDRRMEGLADKGNGNYASIDDAAEARKVLVEQMGATLVTIAKDVKIQVKFNPARVASARLIGYENRKMAHADFRDDAKDAGEIGAGHTVTALYEIVPAAKGEVGAAGLKYKAAKDDLSEKLFSVRVRYKAPDGDVAREQERGVVDLGKDYADADDDYKFAVAVAALGMILRDSPYKGQATYDTVLEWAGATKGVEEPGARRGFLDLVRKAKAAGR